MRHIRLLVPAEWVAGVSEVPQAWTSKRHASDSQCSMNAWIEEVLDAEDMRRRWPPTTNT